MALDGQTAQKSKTALGVLMLTSVGSTEQDPAVRVHDPIGPKLLRWSDGMFAVGKTPRAHPFFRRLVERSDPGAYGFMLARLNHMDDLVRNGVDRGFRQLVILGAGYDTRAYRMREELLGVRIFEVDLPAMSRDKRDRLTRALDGSPHDVEFVEVDFNRQKFSTQLLERGLDPSIPTLFVFCGVSMYLPREAVLDVFSQIAKSSAPRSSIIFDYFFDDVTAHPERYRGAKEWVARARRAGEEPQFGMSMPEAEGLLDACGLILESQHDLIQLADLHLCRSDGSRVADPYDFAAVACASLAS